MFFQISKECDVLETPQTGRIPIKFPQCCQICHSRPLPVLLHNQATRAATMVLCSSVGEGPGSSSEEQFCNIIPKRLVLCKWHHLGEEPCVITDFLQSYFALQVSLSLHDLPPFGISLPNLLAPVKQPLVIGVQLLRDAVLNLSAPMGAETTPILSPCSGTISRSVGSF